MIAHAQLIAAIPALVPPVNAYGPSIIGQSGQRMLAQRTDNELIVCTVGSSFQLDATAQVRFPAPWPRRRGTWAVSPDASLAIFAGVHALRAVDSSGALGWEVHHGCWEGSCRATHNSYDEYADLKDHRYPKRGSAGFSVDGKTLWAHVPGPIPGAWPRSDTWEKWLVLSAADGRMLAWAEADAASEGSHHLPHPTDPCQMGLSIGEGQDGAPVRWGHWDGKSLAVHYIDDDVTLLSVSPSGEWVMSVSHDQHTLTIRKTYGVPAADSLDLDCTSVIRPFPQAQPGNDGRSAYWDWAGGFINETTVVGSTAESDRKWGEGRHWLIDNLGSHPVTQIVYPSPISGRPTALGGGAWYTVSEAGDALQVWALPPEWENTGDEAGVVTASTTRGFAISRGQHAGQ